MAVTAVRFETSTGTLLSALLPFPSWPKLFAPQQVAMEFDPVPMLSVTIAQVCEPPMGPPAAMAVTPKSSAETATGTLLLVLLPLPSWPSPLLPQHTAAPSAVMAQVCCPPAETAVTPEPRPVTATGTWLSASLPFPS